MGRLRAAIRRLMGLVGRAHGDEELARELESHVQMHIDDGVRAGMTPEAARRHALVKLGGIEALKDAYHDRRSLPMIETLLRDLRFGCRMLIRQPGFAAVALSTLALGMAANIVIFGVANALFFRPPAIADPDRVVRVYGNRHSNVSHTAYEEYRDRNQTLSGLALFQGVSLSFRAAGSPEHVFGMTVSGNYFEVIGVGAALGRAIAAADDRPGAAPVLMLSDRAWRRRFGADPGVIGRTVTINGHGYTIAGVAPPRFDGTLAPFVPELWVPWNAPGLGSIDAQQEPQAQDRSGHMIGRLRASVPMSQAQADLATLAAGLAQAQPGANHPATVTVYPADTLGDEFQGGAAAFVALLVSIVGLVLLIACANLATLLLARSSARSREIGIRLSLGASRKRLLFQLLTESLLVSALGGLGAFALASIASRWIERATASLPAPIPLGFDLGFDWRVVLFSCGLAIATTILFGLAPALRASKADVLCGLREGTSTAGPERSRLRATLVAAQIAMSAILLIAGAVLIRSMVSASTIDRGFVSDGVLTVSVDLATRGYSAESGQRFYEALLDGLEAAPGVQSANLVDIVPLTLSNRTGAFLKEGQAPPPPDRQDTLEPVYANAVSRGHFRTLGIPVIAGRDFDRNDQAGRPAVAIVNQELAGRFWPGESPLGKRLREWQGGNSFGEWIEVVGVARDSKYVTLGENPRAFLYRPLAQQYTPMATLLVRAAGAPATAAGSVQSTVRAIDPELPLFNVSTLEAVTSLSLLPVRAAALVTGGLGFVALLLVVIGIYGVVSYLVRQRTREIGIRLALGAEPGGLVRHLVKQSMRWAAAGLALGIGAGLLLTRLLAGLLYGVAATDAFSFAAISTLLVATAYAAAYLPARRATRIDPVSTLRYE